MLARPYILVPLLLAATILAAASGSPSLAAAGGLAALPGTPFLLPPDLAASLADLPDAEGIEDRVDALLESWVPGTGMPLPLELPLLGLVLGDSSLARGKLRTALREGAGDRTSLLFLLALAEARETPEVLDPLARSADLRRAKERLAVVMQSSDSRLEAMRLAARFDRAWVLCQLGEAQEALDLVTEASPPTAASPSAALPAPARERLLTAALRTHLTDRARWREHLDAALRDENVAELGILIAYWPMRMVWTLHRWLDRTWAQLGAGASTTAIDTVERVLEVTNADSALVAGLRSRIDEIQSTPPAERARAGRVDLIASALEMMAAGNSSSWDTVLQRSDSLRTADFPPRMLHAAGVVAQSRTLVFLRRNEYAAAAAEIGRIEALCRQQPDALFDYFIQVMRRHLGFVISDLPMHLDAIERRQRAVERFGGDHYDNDVARGLLEIRLGRPDTAQPILAQAYLEAQRAHKLIAMSLLLEDLAFLHVSQGRSEEARVYGQATLDLAASEEVVGLSEYERGEILEDDSFARVNMAEAVLQQNGAAMADLDSAIAICDAREHHRASIEALLIRAKALLASGELSEALGSAREAATRAEDALAADLRWRAIALEGTIHRRQGNPDAASQSFEVALAALEEQRTGILQEDVRARFLLSAEALVDDYIGALVENGDPSRAYAVDERGRQRTLLEAVAGEPETRSRDAQEVRDTLADEEALLQFHVGTSVTHLWILTADTLQYVSLPVARETLAGDIRTWNAALQVGVPSELGLALFERLLGPVVGDLTGVRRLVIVPDGPLRALSFATLADLLRDHEIAYEASGSLRVASARCPRPQQDWTAGVVAFCFNGGRSARGLPPLRQAEDECELLANLFPQATVQVGSSATPEALRESLPGAVLLHLACHAGFERSGEPFLELAPGADGSGTVHARDLRSWSLSRTGLVVLSGCETALAQSPAATWSPGDLAGLAANLFAAGAGSVLASLWKVDDATTRILMERFYSNLRGGMIPSQALREAQLDVTDGPSAPGVGQRGGAFCIYGSAP
jgi:CHAT domain-containing protein